VMTVLETTLSRAKGYNRTYNQEARKKSIPGGECPEKRGTKICGEWRRQRYHKRKSKTSGSTLREKRLVHHYFGVGIRTK